MNKTVLLLDDDVSFRNQIAPTLEQRGYRVLHASTGAEATQLIGREPVHLIVVDDMLPDIDGLKWLSGLRQKNSDLRVIFASEIRRGLQSRSRLAQELDVSLVLYKPVAPSTLGDQVENLIGRSRPPQAQQRKALLDKTMSTLCADYAKKLPGRLAELAQAVARSRIQPDQPAFLEDALIRAHRLRGSAGSLGFARVGELSGHIETALRSLGEQPAGQTELWSTIERLLAEAQHLVQGGDSSDKGLLSGLGTSRILILDDDPHFLQAIGLMARQHLIDLVVATCAREALAVAREAAPDAAILSLDLRGGTPDDCFVLARQLRALPGCDALPLAFFSANGQGRMAAAHRGASLYLVKPLTADTFTMAIQHLLSAQRALRPHILLVDDDEEFTRLAAAILRCDGMTVTVLHAPLRLLDVLEEVRPDLLLLDVTMPGVSGFDLCRALRTTLEWQALPILFLTAETEVESRVKAFLAGGDDYLSKPILKEEFLARIKVRVDRARLLKERADRDSLTGLLLRRSFLEALGARISEARRHNQPLALCLLDLDRFKTINDTFGHLAGDQVLVGLGKLLSSRLRMEDVRGRWGGEEIILALPSAGAEIAHSLVHRLLQEFETLPFTGDRGESFHASFSAGVAILAEDGNDAEALLKVADRRLYGAKAAGRRQVLATG